jgi:choline transporter-like protein 2/4/5
MSRKRRNEKDSPIDDNVEIEVRPHKPNKRADRIDYEKLKTPLDKHGCTDIICSIIFIIFIFAFIGLSIFSYINGNPSDLILPRDSHGLKCGRDKSVENKKNLLFFDLARCLSVSTAITGCPTPQICVDECPSTNLYQRIPAHKLKLEKYCNKDKYTEKTVCPSYVLKSKPVFGRCMPDIIAVTLNKTSDFIISAFDETDNQNFTIQIDNDNGTKSDLTFDIIKKASKYVTNLLNLKRTFEFAYEDFTNSVWLILTALGIGMILSFILIILLRFFVKPIVYASIFLLLGLLGFGCYFCIDYYLMLRRDEAPSLSDPDFSFEFEKVLDLNYIKTLKDTWLALSIILGVVLLVLTLILLFLRKRIQFAIELIKEASKTVSSVPSTLFWPIVPFLLQLSLITFCISTAVFLASAGIPLYKIVQQNSTNYTDETTPNLNVGDLCDPDTFYLKYLGSNYDCYFYTYGYNTTFPSQIGQNVPQATLAYSKTVDFLNKYQWLPQVYVAFMFFWFSAFVVGLSEMTLAGTFGIWYWTRFSNASSHRKNKLPFLPILRSFFRALFFHFGTIAFGSLLIAIVKLVRLMLSFIDDKLKNAAKSNRCASFMTKCLKCCFWCLEKFIKFVNHNAYIITGVYGFNFCKSAATAFGIIVSNVLRFTVVDKLTGFLLLLSKLAVTAAIGVLSFYFFTKKIPISSVTAFAPELHYYFLPVFVIIIGVYIIAKIFFDVFALCVDTLLLSSLIDAKINDGSPENPYFMSKGLRKILGLKNKKYKDED